jgi:predicted DNA-binding transcriptional regulator AlpA
LLIAEQVAELAQVHLDTFNRWVREGWFPAPLRLGPSRRWRRWRRETVEEFFRQLEDGSRVPPA